MQFQHFVGSLKKRSTRNRTANSSLKHMLHISGSFLRSVYHEQNAEIAQPKELRMRLTLVCVVMGPVLLHDQICHLIRLDNVSVLLSYSRKHKPRRSLPYGRAADRSRSLTTSTRRHGERATVLVSVLLDHLKK